MAPEEVTSMDSILDSVKKILQIADDDTTFDVDIITHINSVFFTLTQLGLGPTNGFQIEDNTAVWSDFLGTSPRYNAVKTYMYLRVRMIFDPPTTGYLVEALEKQILEHEWRLNVNREETDWVDPNPDNIDDEDDIVVDGGGP